MGYIYSANLLTRLSLYHRTIGVGRGVHEEARSTIVPVQMLIIVANDVKSYQ